MDCELAGVKNLADSLDGLVLLKFAVGDDRKEIIRYMANAGARLTDVSDRFLTFKFVGSKDHIEKLLKGVQKYDLREVLHP